MTAPPRPSPVEKLALTAGTDESDVDRASNNIDSDDVNKLYTYSTRSNGTYTLKALGSGNKAGYESAVNLKSGSITGSNKIDNFSISDDAVVFALYGSATNGVRHDVKVLTGKTVNDWKASGLLGGFTLPRSPTVSRPFALQ